MLKLVIGIALFIAGVVVTALSGNVIWTGALIFGAYLAGPALFTLSRRRRWRILLASGATTWSCRACGEDNPMSDGAICRACKVSFVELPE